MSQLARNSYFKNLLADEIFIGEPAKVVEGDYNCLKVSVQTDVSGTLSVLQSIDGLNYESYDDVFDVVSTTHKQIHIKGRYLYVRYENGDDDTTNFSLYSILSKTSTAGNLGLQEVLVTNDYLDVSGAVTVNGLLFDASGNLKVSEVDISGVSVVDDKLAVLDISANSELVTIRQLLADSISVINYGILSNDPNSYLPIGVDISGAMFVTVKNPQTVVELSGVPVVEISGNVVTELSGSSFTDAKLNVFDASANVQLSKLSFYEDAYNAFDLRTQVMNEIGVSVNNTPTVALSGGTEVGLVSGTQVNLVSGAQVLLSLGSEVALSAGSQVAISSGSEIALVSGSSVYSKTQDNNGNAIASVSTADGYALNTAMFAYDANDSNEKRVRLGTGGGLLVENITPIEISGNLYVANDLSANVLNDVSVVNASGTQMAVKAQQYGSYGNLANNVASILPSGVTSGIDVSNWSYYLGAYEDYNGATSGTISLEYSFDDITYYTLFNTQIFPSGTPRRANITKQDIPGINYIRLKNGTSSTLTSVTVTLVGGSVS